MSISMTVPWRSAALTFSVMSAFGAFEDSKFPQSSIPMCCRVSLKSSVHVSYDSRRKLSNSIQKSYDSYSMKSVKNMKTCSQYLQSGIVLRSLLASTALEILSFTRLKRLFTSGSSRMQYPMTDNNLVKIQTCLISWPSPPKFVSMSFLAACLLTYSKIALNSSILRTGLQSAGKSSPGSTSF